MKMGIIMLAVMLYSCSTKGDNKSQTTAIAALAAVSANSSRAATTGTTTITNTATVSMFAGSGIASGVDGTGIAASFKSPYGIAVDSSGNVYVSESVSSTLSLNEVSNHKIRKITSAGVVTTVAGSGIAGATDGIGTAASFNSPLGITVDSTGNLFVADTYNNKIRKIVQ